ncbi:complement factor B-like [Diadema antillarum]|uniref:complement factor B-like n=1 Tax=Diadema antillarum TaxID=105358 RepID=UPI003A8AB254
MGTYVALLLVLTALALGQGVAPTICPPPSQIENGFMRVRGRWAGGRAVYRCNPGFYLLGRAMATCNSNGEWTYGGDEPECVPSLRAGTGHVIDGLYTEHSVCSAECPIGFVPSRDYILICHDGEWVPTGEIPECLMVTCPYPGRDHLRNGHVTFSNTSMTIGTKMTLRCNSLYTLLGSSERVCQADGTWNGTLTSCHREDYECRALGNPIHGSMYSLSGGKGVEPQFKIGETVYFRCDHDVNENNEPRYEMVGSRERFCNRNEEWTGEMPRCLERHEFDPSPIVNQGLGEIFDEIAVESGSWESNNDTNRAGSRRRRSIDLNNRRGIDIWFAFDSSGSIGDYNFLLAKRFAKGLVLKISQNGSLGGARIGALRYASQSDIAFGLESGSTTDQVNRLIDDITYTQDTIGQLDFDKISVFLHAQP